MINQFQNIFYFGLENSFLILMQEKQFIIRQERQEDYRNVEVLNRQAFWNIYSPGCQDHFFVHELRSHPDYIKELCFVVEQKQQIIAHILYHHTKILYEDGTIVSTITFGPVCVDPHLQQRGIGSLLIRHSFQKAKELGHKAVIITGHPSIYTRLGFRCSKQFNIKDDHGDYLAHMLVIELDQNYLPRDQEGIFFYLPDYYMDAQKLQEFDKNFPEKEKYETLSQHIYQHVIKAKWNQPYNTSLKDMFDTRKISE